LPAFETAIEKKKLAGELDRDAMFAKLKQLGGKTAGNTQSVVARIASSPHPLIPHTSGSGVRLKL
jgi:hypothetical protein